MDLGEAMARSAGWREVREMKPVQAIKQRAPSYSRTDPDCCWSVGVINLTEAEADMVVQFANRVRTMGNDRARGNGYTATEMRQIVAERARGGRYGDPNGEPYRCAQGHLVPGGPGEECQLCLAEYRDLKMTAEMRAERRALLTGSWDPKNPGFDDTDWGRYDPNMLPLTTIEKEPLTKPSEPGNRFSGLDLGEKNNG